MFLGVAYVLSNHSQPVRARVAHGPPLSWFYATNGGGSGSIEPCMTISPLHYELRLDESGCTAQSPAWCNAQAAVGARPSLGKAVELREVQPDLLSTQSSPPRRRLIFFPFTMRHKQSIEDSSSYLWRTIEENPPLEAKGQVLSWKYYYDPNLRKQRLPSQP